MAPSCRLAGRTRTTNPIESPFAALRLRTDAAKRLKKVANATAMVWKLLMIGEKSFRRLQGTELLREVCLDTEFEDGEKVNKAKEDRPAA